jgi:Protein of unknown function (DUF1698)
MRTAFYRAAFLAKSALLTIGRPSATDHYVTSAPSPQQALDIFKGEWASRLPAPFDACEAGALPLFGDPRLQWAVDRLGGVADRRVIELGPLEGGHTWMLEQLGAARITAVEASTRAFLKCLTVKELTGLRRADFLCGDSVAYLREARERFDVGIASGILYHLVNPIELIALLAARCDRIYLWTAYYDEARIRQRPKLAARFAGATQASHEGFAHALYRYRYQTALFRPGFSGGSAPHSHWLTRDTILAACRHFGFTHIDTAFEEPDHVNGPAFAFVASR